MHDYGVEMGGIAFIFVHLLESSDCFLFIVRSIVFPVSRSTQAHYGESHPSLPQLPVNHWKIPCSSSHVELVRGGARKTPPTRAN